MSETGEPLIYLVLGAPGSGRREVLADLIEDGLEPAGQASVLLADMESPNPFDERFPNLTRWTWQDGQIAAPLPAVPPVFFVADGRRNPVDQVEAFKLWLDEQGGILGRILCVMNVRLAEKHPPLMRWFEACAHFADVVLINRRDGVENEWLSSFLTRFRKQFPPTLLEVLKDGRVANPALILDPQARRMTHLFDFDDDPGCEIEDGPDDGEEARSGEVPNEFSREDPYLVRRGGGRRLKELPDIGIYLGGG